MPSLKTLVNPKSYLRAVQNRLEWRHPHQPDSRGTLMKSSFTAHNVVLDDGSQTLPQRGMVMGDYPLVKSTKRLLDLLFPGDKRQIHLVDLACLEGGYATEFARQGFETLGIEVRKSNFQNCLYVKDHVSLPNLNFVNDNVWNLEKRGIVFDVIFCSGILYHLAKPKAFIEMMSRCCRKLIVINTHFATDNKCRAHQLSRLTENEGLPGRWYYEHPGVDTQAVLEGMKWASWENSSSFWVKREFLIQAIKDAGFDLVFEQYDHLGKDLAQQMIAGSYRQQDRGTFVGIKV